MTDTRRQPLVVRNAAGEIELALYGVLDPYDPEGISARQVREQLKAAGPGAALRVRIHSIGGSIFEGLAIYNLVRGFAGRKVVQIDGMALSMASVVAMAGDEIEIAANAYLMIHNPLAGAWGEADELRELADLLDRFKAELVSIYAGRTGRPAAEIAALMDLETWLNGAEAVAGKFADRVGPALQLAAAGDLRRFTRVPGALFPLTPSSTEPSVMSQDTNTPAAPAAPITPTPTPPAAAQYRELKAAFPKASAEFITSQLDAAATIDQARAAWQSDLERRAEAAEARAAELATAAAAARPGVPPVATPAPAAGSEPPADPIAAWDAAVARAMAGGLTRQRATLAVARAQPELRAAFVTAHNAAHGR